MDVVQGSLAHAETAEGRRFIRQGFGATPDDDLLYALGWPYFAWLEPGDAKRADLADARKFSAKYVYSVGPRPEGVVKRNLRHTLLFGTGADELEAIQNDAPLSSRELERIFDALMDAQFGFVTALLLESVTSPEIVLDAILSRLKALPPEAWKQGDFETFGGGCVRALHFLLLRSDADHSHASRARLEALWDRSAAPALEGGSRVARTFDLVLHGRDGVERSGQRLGQVLQNDAMFAIDDLAYVRTSALAFIPKMVARDRASVSARLAFLGGDPVIDAIATHVGQVHSTARDDLALGLSRCAHPRVAGIMTALGTPAAKRWLKKKAHL
jgi:hypothetical protein